MQIAGGLIVLVSINTNLGIFRDQTLFAVVIGGIRACLLEHPVTVALGGARSRVSSGTVTASSTRSATTLDERIAEVERQIEQDRLVCDTQFAAIRQLIETGLSTSIASSQSALNQVSANLEAATVGGFKWQIFGVLLVIYGALVGFFLVGA